MSTPVITKVIVWQNGMVMVFDLQADAKRRAGDDQ